MKKLATIALTLSLTACATHQTGANWTPVIDTKGGDSVKLAEDVRECQAYARQTADAATAGAVGAVAGAILGAIFMAASGGNGYRNEAAAMGAISGGLTAAGAAETDQRSLISRCLAGRGHRVLN